MIEDVDERFQLAPKVEGSGGHQLGHEVDHKLFARVDPENRAGRTAPGEFAEEPDALGTRGAEIDRESQSESRIATFRASLRAI